MNPKFANLLPGDYVYHRYKNKKHEKERRKIYHPWPEWLIRNPWKFLVALLRELWIRMIELRFHCRMWKEQNRLGFILVKEGKRRATAIGERKLQCGEGYAVVILSHLFSSHIKRAWITGWKKLEVNLQMRKSERHWLSIVTSDR